MLLCHYSRRMTMDTLCFNEVSTDDPSVTGPEYVCMQADSFSELEGSDMWWKVPPPSGEWRVTKCDSIQVHSVNGLFKYGNTRRVQRTKRKTYKARQEENPRPPKNTRKAKSKMFISSNEKDKVEAGPSTGAKLKGKGKLEAPQDLAEALDAPEVSKV
ncbi:hypothetical protein JVT61DRAFT_3674 [Boletus reticuloceps]|uniref:Uncharacterized protein n=1 Tax=Boletus reticuloceps TaxID=495285 RepID=A0A8I3A9B2_9AGAM|nr:hypothetical protein JVT61DRAFT_3674 [Boletus reticuloceps]